MRQKLQSMGRGNARQGRRGGRSYRIVHGRAKGGSETGSEDETLWCGVCRIPCQLPRPRQRGVGMSSADQSPTRLVTEPGHREPRQATTDRRRPSRSLELYVGRQPLAKPSRRTNVAMRACLRQGAYTVRKIVDDNRQRSGIQGEGHRSGGRTGPRKGACG